MDDTRRRGRGLRVLAGVPLTAVLALATTAVSAQELVWARYGDIDSLDPHRATSTLSMQVWDQIYDTLLAFDMDGKPGPNMAKSWTVSDDGLEYTFTLNEGIKCHDGTDFDANDVKFTIDRAFGDTPSLTRTSWGPITDVTVVDPLSFKVTLGSKFGAFLPFLADSFSSMICDTNTVDTFGSATAIGTGPFVLDEWVKGSEVALSKNPDYVNFGEPYDNKGAPHIDKLLIRTVPEAQTRLAALRTGEVDIAEPPFDDIESIKSAGELEIMVAENTGQDVFWEFTTSRPPFDDIRARQAVAYATDPQMAIDIIYGGLTNREWCPVARGVFGNDQEFCKQFGYEYDPEKAKALLAEMGFGPDNPMKTTMFVWTGGNRHKLAEIFQSQLAQVGIEAGIEIMDIGTMNARVKAQNEDATSDEPGTFDMMTWSWYDPDILYQLWHSPGAYSGFSTPELDAMLEETRTTIEPEARLEKVQAVIQYLMENAVHIGLYSPGWEWVFAVRPEVEGFKVGPFLHPSFLDVKMSSDG
ncbi:ABC transporter substrate-binding protein [Chachezhania sediminis]|uniref:ABC transporter substrate-binding protein n=1 Tax=Chachezhania sediminis TaxID=2599291 RepID=UPI001E33B42E|nr:ABC transporter substrate-binding protein [Chachezhania sediminis]